MVSLHRPSDFIDSGLFGLLNWLNGGLMAVYRDYAAAMEDAKGVARAARVHEQDVMGEAVQWLKDRGWDVKLALVDCPNDFPWHDRVTGGRFDFYAALLLEQKRVE